MFKPALTASSRLYKTCYHHRRCLVNPSFALVTARNSAPRCSSRNMSSTKQSQNSQKADPREESKTDFGYRQVKFGQKEKLVGEVFTSVASNYDIMNDLMSGGVHRLWKDNFVDASGVKDITTSDHDFPIILDVAGGTGDIAFRFAKLLADDVQRNGGGGDDLYDSPRIVISDINADMLNVGQKRANDLFTGPVRSLLDFTVANAEDLPFEDDTFDLYTIAFGLRNVTDKRKAIQEAFRVLRPGGRYMCMEFSKIELGGPQLILGQPFGGSHRSLPPFPDQLAQSLSAAAAAATGQKATTGGSGGLAGALSATLQQAYDLYSFNAIPYMGEMVANDRAAYQYLVESIRQFPSQQELEGMLQECGLVETSYVNYTLGVVAVHTGFKPV